MVVSKEIVIGISPGIHFRPAEKITNSALEFDSKVSIIRDDYNANAKSFLNLIGAGFRYGEKVTLICGRPACKPYQYKRIKHSSACQLR